MSLLSSTSDQETTQVKHQATGQEREQADHEQADLYKGSASKRGPSTQPPTSCRQNSLFHTFPVTIQLYLAYSDYCFDDLQLSLTKVT